jgi:HJR/Mrr/RecB family endonuclease
MYDTNINLSSPLKGWVYITSPFVMRDGLFAGMHKGIDLVAKKDDYVLAIQAKCYTGTVGNHAIMEAVAGTKYYNANQTMVITNSTFTKSAVELAAVNNVILWDRQVLIEKLANG